MINTKKAGFRGCVGKNVRSGTRARRQVTLLEKWWGITRSETEPKVSGMTIIRETFNFVCFNLNENGGGGKG